MFKVLRPCIVPQTDGTATSYRRHGEIISVPDQADADRLTAGGFIEQVGCTADPGKIDVSQLHTRTPS